MRFLPYLALLAGCDKLFSLNPVPDAAPPIEIDAAADATVDVPSPDAPPAPWGCSDETREGFTDTAVYPAIAACSGAWSIPGLRPDPIVSCGRAAGNDGVKLLGAGCSAADLCAIGWHVCRTRLEVLEALPLQSRSCAGLGAAADTFYATGQSGPGGGNCDTTGTDDVFGCGTFGAAAQSSCTPLDLTASNDCFAVKTVGGWSCAYPNEVENIYKTEPLVGGGVLCCRDTI